MTKQICILAFIFLKLFRILIIIQIYFRHFGKVRKYSPGSEKKGGKVALQNSQKRAVYCAVKATEAVAFQSLEGIRPDATPE